MRGRGGIPIFLMALFAGFVDFAARIKQRLRIAAIGGGKGFETHRTQSLSQFNERGTIGINQFLDVRRRLDARKIGIRRADARRRHMPARQYKQIGRLDQRERIGANRAPFIIRARLLFLEPGFAAGARDRRPQKIRGRIDLRQHQFLNRRDGRIGTGRSPGADTTGQQRNDRRGGERLD